MKKKLLSVLLSTAMVATLLMGCGSQAATEEPAAPSAEESAPAKEAATEAATTEAAVWMVNRYSEDCKRCCTFRSCYG